MIDSKDELIKQSKSNHSASYSNLHNSKMTSSNSCRICLCEDDDDMNPMMTPCSCMGSVRFIHYLCLQQWLD